jgi:multisubunit Na+/H+ antiporter MnhF subunit
MKTVLGMALIVVLVAAIFTALGLAEKNHMLGFGLFLAVLSGLVTVALAATAKIQAVRAIFVPTPAVVENKSFSFSNTTAIQNYRCEEHRELASLRQDLRALQDKHDSAAFELTALKTHMRLCFDNIRYHEEITLPYALAGQVGTVIVATMLTLIGTALCAFPDCAYMLAKAVTALLVMGWQHVGHWLAG